MSEEKKNFHDSFIDDVFNEKAPLANSTPEPTPKSDPVHTTPEIVLTPIVETVTPPIVTPGKNPNGHIDTGCDIVNMKDICQTYGYGDKKVTIFDNLDFVVKDIKGHGQFT